MSVGACREQGRVLRRGLLEGDTCFMLVETSRAEWTVFNPSQDLGYQRALVVAMISCCGGKKSYE